MTKYRESKCNSIVWFPSKHGTWRIMTRERSLLDAKMSCRWDNKDIELQGATQDRMNWLQSDIQHPRKIRRKRGKSNISAEISD